MSVMIAMRQPHEFAIHIGAGLNNGLTLKEILTPDENHFAMLRPRLLGFSRAMARRVRLLEHVLKEGFASGSPYCLNNDCKEASSIRLLAANQ